MKKTTALLLALVVVCSLSVSAFAGPSATGGNADNNATAYVPAVKAATAELVSVNEAALTAEQNATVEAARASLAEVAPEGYVAQYVCYAQADKYPAEATIEVANATEVVVKLFVNGAWQEIVCKVVDGKAVITIPCEGVLAIFTK